MVIEDLLNGGKGLFSKMQKNQLVRYALFVNQLVSFYHCCRLIDGLSLNHALQCT